MKKIFFLLLLLPINQTYANVANMFGASANSLSLGGQEYLRNSNAGANYNHPAFLGFNNNLKFSLNSTLVNYNFKPFGEIVVQNDTNSQTGEKKEIVNTKIKETMLAQMHAALPIKGDFGTVGVSVMAPFGTLAQTDSGNPFLPEYVMYKGRHKRTTVHLNYAKSFNNSFATSLGVHLGFQAGAKVDVEASLNGTPYGSSANANTKIEPSLGVIASFAYLGNNSAFGFTFQQEMKSNFLAKSLGVINDPVSLPFEIQIESMIYYDPHIFRINYQYDFGPIEMLLGGDYQIWDNYKAPIIYIRRDTGGVILPSDNYEKITTKNIFIPKLGFVFKLSDEFHILTGVSYRPTPLKGDFKESGNSIDTDSYHYGVGLEYQTLFFGKKSKFVLAGQYVDLKKKQVVKSSGLEDGGIGNKLGSPGYPIDGKVQIISVGVSMEI